MGDDVIKNKYIFPANLIWYVVSKDLEVKEKCLTMIPKITCENNFNNIQYSFNNN